MIMDFSKTKEVEVVFKSVDGELFEFSGVVTALLLETIEKNQEDMSKDILGKKVNPKDMKEMKLDASKMLELQKKADDNLLKAFFKEDYTEYVKASKGIERQANSYVLGLINQAIIDINGDNTNEEKKK